MDVAKAPRKGAGMSGDHNQYQKPDKCGRCGEVNPAEIHTCTPKQECRDDGRCQYAIDHGAEGLGRCPKGECCMPKAQPKQEEGCAGCGKQASEGWALYCVKCIETVQEPVGWIYEDDEGRMMFTQMPHPDPLWEPVYRAKRHD